MKEQMTKYIQKGIFVLSVLFVFGNLSVFVGCGERKTSRQPPKALFEAVKYLSDIPEVKWVDLDDNNIYIGFNPVPDDMIAVCTAAALHGNKAINFGVHVWAINAARYNKGWRPGDGSYIYETTARHGKIE